MVTGLTKAWIKTQNSTISLPQVDSLKDANYSLLHKHTMTINSGEASTALSGSEASIAAPFIPNITYDEFSSLHYMKIVVDLPSGLNFTLYPGVTSSGHSWKVQLGLYFMYYNTNSTAIYPLNVELYATRFNCSDGNMKFETNPMTITLYSLRTNPYTIEHDNTLNVIFVSNYNMNSYGSSEQYGYYYVRNRNNVSFFNGLNYVTNTAPIGVLGCHFNAANNEPYSGAETSGLTINTPIVVEVSIYGA